MTWLMLGGGAITATCLQLSLNMSWVWNTLLKCKLCPLEGFCSLKKKKLHSCFLLFCFRGCFWQQWVIIKSLCVRSFQCHHIKMLFLVTGYNRLQLWLQNIRIAEVTIFNSICQKVDYCSWIQIITSHKCHVNDDYQLMTVNFVHFPEIWPEGLTFLTGK